MNTTNHSNSRAAFLPAPARAFFYPFSRSRENPPTVSLPRGRFFPFCWGLSLVSCFMLLNQQTPGFLTFPEPPGKLEAVQSPSPAHDGSFCTKAAVPPVRTPVLAAAQCEGPSSCLWCWWGFLPEIPSPPQFWLTTSVLLRADRETQLSRPWMSNIDSTAHLSLLWQVSHHVHLPMSNLFQM